MNDMYGSIEIIWNYLLSQQPARVHQAFDDLNTSEQQAVLAHLRKMASEPGWQPEQRRAAQAALEILGSSNTTE